MFRVLLWILLAWFLYKFIFDVLVPLVKVTVKVRRQMNDFKQQFNNLHQEGNTADSHHTQPNNTTATNKPKAGDYIDFEEIKGS